MLMSGGEPISNGPIGYFGSVICVIPSRKGIAPMALAAPTPSTPAAASSQRSWLDATVLRLPATPKPPTSGSP